MPPTRELPFGRWPSPVTPALLAGDKTFSDVAWDGDTLVWCEGRGSAGVLCAQTGADAPRELTREPSVRAGVGYGGGEFGVAGGTCYFAVHRNGSLWRSSLADGSPRAITPAHGSPASPTPSPDGRCVAYVHHDGTDDRIAIADAAGLAWPQVFASGHDFFMQPRWSPDGRRFAFVAWDHPHMPWVSSTLYLADVVSANPLPRLANLRAIAGGAHAVEQPEFLDNGRLLYVSDETGWPQLWSHDLTGGERRQLTEGEAEYGVPAWIQGIRTFALGHDRTYVVCLRNERGFTRAERLDLANGRVTPIEALSGYTSVAQPAVASHAPLLACIVANAVTPARVVVCELGTARVRVVARSSADTVVPEALSAPEAVQATGPGGVVHGLFYPPSSTEYSASGKPPLIVHVHGGPTSQSRATYNPRVQFFTTRGWAVLEVNYRGSTGYGRAYMEALKGGSGVVEVEDVAAVVRHLRSAGRIDPKLAVVIGGSAGGYVVYQALILEPELFTAGISFYGVADPLALAKDTHKFEARYLDWLVGPLPESAALYRERAPVHHADRITKPLAIFQGDDDTAVPKSQSDAIVSVLARRGVPHVYHVYAGEGHGFRKPESIAHWYGAMEQFLLDHVL